MGKKTARYFSYNLANKNINIISGLAKGVDSYAHIGTLSTVGKTIAVVGNGLDSVYPVENKELLYRILKKKVEPLYLNIHLELDQKK